MECDVRIFPRDRIQRLLDHRKYEGLGSTVKVEGSFIQVGSGGIPERQVFLGITPSEFVIVKQELEIMPVTGPYVLPIDLCDLEVDHVIPLAVLRFFILDERARRFTVCTCLDQMYYFEMCQLELDTDLAWLKWRSVLLELGAQVVTNLDYTMWKSPYVLNVKSSVKNKFEIARNVFGRPKLKMRYFLYHPHTFCQVQSVGVQTWELEFEPSTQKSIRPKTGSSKEESLTSIDKNVSAESSPPFQIENIVAKNSVRFYTDKLRAENETEKIVRGLLGNETFEDANTKLLRSALQKRLTVITTGSHSTDRRQYVSYGLRRRPKRSRSWSELDSTLKNDPSIELDYQAKTVRGRCQYARKLLVQRRQPRKNAGRAYLLLRALEVSSDTDLQGGQHILTKHEKRSGKQLWQLVRSLLLKSSDIGRHERRLQEAASYVIFNVSAKRKDSPPLTLIDFHPLDVSMTLASLSRKLVMSLGVADLQLYTASAGKQVPESILSLMMYENEICKMVVLEVLRNYHLDFVAILKFFIQVCFNLMFAHRDMQSVTAILKGLTSLPVYRLNYMWTAFALRQPLSFRQFLAMLPLVSSRHKSLAYAKRVSHFLTTGVLFIPLPKHLLAHCRTRKETVISKSTQNLLEKSKGVGERVSDLLLKMTNTKKKLDEEEDDNEKPKSILSTKTKLFIRRITHLGPKKKKHRVSFGGEVEDDENRAGSSLAGRNRQGNALDLSLKNRKQRKKEGITEEDIDEDNEKTRNGKNNGKKKTVFQAMKKKMMSERDVMTDHINVIQQDIADIEELLEDITIYEDVEKSEEPVDTEEMQKKRLARTLAKERRLAREAEQKKKENILETLYGKLEESEIKEIIEDEQVPYKPKAKSSDRYINLLKNSIDEHVSEETENEDFEKLVKENMAYEKPEDFILYDEDSDTENERGRRLAVKRSVQNVVKSMTKFFEDKTHPHHEDDVCPNHNNSAWKEAKDIELEPRSISNSWLVEDKQKPHICPDCCELCGNEPCLYMGRNYYRQFLEQQSTFRYIRVKSKQEVAEYLKKTFPVNRYLNEYDLMQLSQSCE